MGLQDVPRCQHVKVNGVQCGSPALKRRRRCYFHEGVRIERQKFVDDQFATSRFDMPVLEDANAVQMGLMKVIQWLGSGRMDPKIAGLMLYALQTASCNLKNTTFESSKPTDVVIDPKDVDRTCIHGPQWFERDFADQEESDTDYNMAPVGLQATAEGGPVESHPDVVPNAELCQNTAGQNTAGHEAVREPAVCRTQARGEKPRDAKRKRPEYVENSEDSILARDFLYRIRPEIARVIEKAEPSV
jgi:hypothetical protein